MSISVHRPPLVGRDPEMAVLVSLVRTMRRGGRLAVVEGEAGIGKTRLVEAALEEARATGAEVLASRAEELDAYRPFAAIVDCVPEPWRERVDAHLRAWETRPDAAAERQFRVAETAAAHTVVLPIPASPSTRSADVPPPSR